MNSEAEPPILLTRKEAANLLRISMNTFDRRVSDCLPKLRIGSRILFKRIDIESWINNDHGSYERPALFSQGDRTWDKKEPSKGSFYVTGFGTSKNKSTGSEFERAVEQLINEKPRNT